MSGETPTAQEAIAPLLAALHAWQRSPDEVTSRLLEEAAQLAHRTAIDAFAAGKFDKATAILANMQVLVLDFYRHDPLSLHALYGDYGTLLGEHGDFVRAAALLDLALAAAAGCGEHAMPLSLKTLATYIGMSQTAGDDARVDTLLRQAQAIAGSTELDALTAFKLNAAKASVMLARGRTADAEQLLHELPIALANDALHAPEMSRCWWMLAQSYAGRQSYKAAFEAHANALAIIERHPEHRHARADAIAALAQTRRRVSSGSLLSLDWWRSKALFTQALRLQRSPAPPNSSTGCAELSALALMALRERRVSRALRLHREAILLARRSWSLRSREMQDLLLGRVAIDMARQRFSACFKRLRRIQDALRLLGPAAAKSLANARALEAELYRRVDQPAQAAIILEDLVTREIHEFASAVGANWSAHEAGLARRGVLTTHALVDAVLPLAQTDSATRAQLFRVIAHSQDLGLRTLQQIRGAAPAQFKTAPTAAAVAAILPMGDVFVQFFRRTPRTQGFSGAEWRPEHAEYIALVVHAGHEDVALIHLGAAQPLDDAIEHLVHQMDTGDKRLDLSCVQHLRNALAPHLWHARCVFFAPDSALQAFPFSMLTHYWPLPRPHPVAILVESAARWMGQHRDGERLPSARKPAVICVPDCGVAHFPYAFLPGAIKEADRIAALLGAPVEVLPGTPAAKSLLVAVLARGHDLIHLCGHADVFKRPVRWQRRSRVFKADQLVRLTSSEDPFDSARLILGGFNDWVAGDPTLPSPEQTSMTATELSSMDLRRVGLFTLSTCRGARGMQQPLEAPASLATAIRFAGAGVVIAALWAVPDHATAFLMERLYTHRQTSRSVSMALACAQSDLAMHGYPASDWAAFVVWADANDV
jgi:hypothetical protein